MQLNISPPSVVFRVGEIGQCPGFQVEFIRTMSKGGGLERLQDHPKWNAQDKHFPHPRQCFVGTGQLPADIISLVHWIEINDNYYNGLRDPLQRVGASPQEFVTWDR